MHCQMRVGTGGVGSDESVVYVRIGGLDLVK